VTAQETLEDAENAQAWAHQQEIIQRQLEESKMAAFEQKDNEGALFREENKKSDNHPDMTGKALIGGTEYRMAGWTNTSKSGKKYLKVNFSIPQDNGRRNQEPDEDAVPF
jgi:hypothetical protein